MARRLTRYLRRGLITLAFLVVVGYALAYSFFNGRPLADFICGLVNPHITGRLEIGSVKWRPWLLADFLIHRRHRVHVLGFRIVNPAGKSDLWVPEATARISLWQLIRGRVALHDIRVIGKGTQIVFDTDPHKGFLATWKSRTPGKSNVYVYLDAFVDPIDIEVKVGQGLRFKATGAKTPFEFELGGAHPRLRIAPVVPHAVLTMLDTEIPVSDVRTELLGTKPEAPEDFHFAMQARAQGAEVRFSGPIRGVFSDHPGVSLDLGLDFSKGGGLLRFLGRKKVGDAVMVDGPQAQGHVHLTGHPDTFFVDADAKDLDVAIQALPLKLSRVATRLRWDSDSGKVTLHALSGRLGTGEMSLRGAADPLGGTFEGFVQLKHVDPSPFLPPKQQPLVAGRLSGTASVRGTFGTKAPARYAVRELSLLFEPGRTAALRLPLRIAGAGTLSASRLEIERLRVETASVSASATGRVALKSGALDLSISASAPRLEPLLTRLGAPEAVRSVAGAVDLQAHAQGTLGRPIATGTATITNLGAVGMRVPRLRADLALDGTTLRVTNIAGSGPAGSLVGRGTYDLAQATGEVTLTLRELDLGRLDPRFVGRGEIDVRLAGPIAAPKGSLALRAPAFTLQGDRYAGELVAALDGQGMRITRLHLGRAAGGTFTGGGTADFKGNLDLHFDASRFPIVALPFAPKLPPSIAGTLSGRLHIGGDVRNPIPSGSVDLAGARIRNIHLGNGRLEMTPGGDSIALRGTFFNRFSLRGNLTLPPDFALSVAMTFDKLAIEQLIPELTQYAELRGVATGGLRLSISATGPPHVSASLSELAISAEGTDDDGVPRRIELANRGDVQVIYEGKRIRFESLRLVSDHGEIQIEGFLDQAASDLTVRGDLDLELIEYFARSAFKHTHGETRANLHLTGPMLRPEIAGTLDLNKVTLEPRSFDRPIAIPTGHATFTHDGVELSDLTIRMDDAVAHARGRLDWKDFAQPRAQVELQGKVPAQLFELLAPDAIADAEGMLSLRLLAEGPVRSPSLQGAVQVAAPGLVFEFRGYGRQVKVLDALVEMNAGRIVVRRVHGKIDDGDVEIDGTLRLDALRPRDINLHIQASELPFRDPGILTLTLAANLVLRGDLDSLQLAGERGGPGSVDIVEGKYIQQFESPLKSAVLRPRTREETVPFWTGVPPLESLKLNVEVHSRGFFSIENNIARQVKLETHLAVGGTVTDPEIGGEIRVQEGAFSIPLLKGNEFIAVPGGAITFYPYKRFPETPELNIQAEKSYTDNNDQDHLVRLKFTGPLGAPVWSLETNTGLNTGQTLVLLTTGRPPSELRSALRGEGRAGAGGASDQLAKELSGSALQEIISDPLNRFLRLDALSLYVGPESVDVRARKRLILRPRLDLVGLQSIGILNRSYFEGKVELKLHDNVFIEGELQRFSRGVETEQESLDRGRAQVRFQFRLR